MVHRFRNDIRVRDGVYLFGYFGLFGFSYTEPVVPLGFFLSDELHQIDCLFNNPVMSRKTGEVCCYPCGCNAIDSQDDRILFRCGFIDDPPFLGDADYSYWKLCYSFSCGSSSVLLFPLVFCTPGARVVPAFSRQRDREASYNVPECCGNVFDLEWLRHVVHSRFMGLSDSGKLLDLQKMVAGTAMRRGRPKVMTMNEGGLRERL